MLYPGILENIIDVLYSIILLINLVKTFTNVYKNYHVSGMAILSSFHD